MADSSQELGFRQVRLLSFQFCFLQARLCRSALADFLTQLAVGVRQRRGTLFDPVFKIVISLFQRQSRFAALGNVANEYKKPDHITALIKIGHIGAQHEAHLPLLTSFFKLEVHTMASQHFQHLWQQPLIQFRRVQLIKTHTQG